jgi:hypothetical protein
MARLNHAARSGKQNHPVMPSGFDWKGRAPIPNELVAPLGVQPRPRPIVGWHMSCVIRGEIENMATKATLMKLLQESRGYEQVTNRRPTPRPIVLYLMQLRAQNPNAHAPRQPLTITAEWSNSSEMPMPVKIKQIRPGECELPVVFI